MTETPSTDCPRTLGCPMYPLFKTKSFLNSVREMYCEADYARCVRFIRASAGETVPASLMPNGKDLNDSRKSE